MADKILYVLSNGALIPVQLHDINGDGSLYAIAAYGGSGGSSTIAGPLGRAADAASVSIAWSTEDVALITGRLPAGATLAPAATIPSTTIIGAADMRSNGTTLDPELNNTQGQLLASAARTASTAFVTGPTNYNARGAMFFLDISAASGTGGLQLQVVGLDPVSNNPYILHASFTAVIATGQKGYVIYPGAASAGGNITATTQTILPRVWQYRVLAGDSSSYTYSLGYAFIL